MEIVVKKFLIVAVMVLGVSVGCLEARPRLFKPAAVRESGARQGGLAQAHSALQALTGRVFHSNKFVNGASAEGVGFSTVSADDAIRHCCFWGQRQPMQVGVQRGVNGWYATVQYK